MSVIKSYIKTVLLQYRPLPKVSLFAYELYQGLYNKIINLVNLTILYRLHIKAMIFSTKKF